MDNSYKYLCNTIMWCVTNIKKNIYQQPNKGQVIVRAATKQRPSDSAWYR